MYVVDRTSRFIVGAILAAFVVAAVGMSAAKAEQAPTPTASEFLANPGQLLQQNANGGSLLANAVQQLALSDPSTFKVLLGLVANANDAQKGAIGQGLAQAAKIEVLTNQTLAADWQQQIAAITDPSFKTAATNAFGDVQLGAVGGGALGAAGGNFGGVGGGVGGGGPQDIRSNPTNTPSFTITGGTSGSSFTGGSSTTTITSPVPGGTSGSSFTGGSSTTTITSPVPGGTSGSSFTGASTTTITSPVPGGTSGSSFTGGSSTTTITSPVSCPVSCPVSASRL
jgi:hypothetical protein